MIWFFGTRNCGKVDHVPGLFYVVLSFFHIQFVPLVPTGSMIMLDDGSERGMKISMSGKSVLIAYLRTFLILAGIVAIIVGVICVSQRDILPAAVLLPLGVGMIVFFFVTYKLTRPGAERAVYLAQELGLPPEVLAEYFVRNNMPLPSGLEQSYNEIQEVEPVDDSDQYNGRYDRSPRRDWK